MRKQVHNHYKASQNDFVVKTKKNLCHYLISLKNSKCGSKYRFQDLKFLFPSMTSISEFSEISEIQTKYFFSLLNVPPDGSIKLFEITSNCR